MTRRVASLLLLTGGLCLSLGADIRVAAESAEFNGTGVVNGLTSTELGASYLLPRLIGVSRAAEILLTGRKVGAAEAERIGLVSGVVPDQEVVDHCLAIATAMCEFSPHGIAMTKASLWANLEISSLAAAMCRPPVPRNRMPGACAPSARISPAPRWSPEGSPAIR